MPCLISDCSRLLCWSSSQCSTQLLFTPVVLVVVSVFHSVIVHSCRFGRCLSVPLSDCSLLSFRSLSQCSTQLLFTADVLVVVSVFHSVIVHSCRFGRCLSVPLSYCSLASVSTQSEHVGRELSLVKGIKCHCTDVDSTES